MKLISRILLPLVVALVCFASGSSALAQSTKTWMPEFNPDQHVYIDSRLENHRSKPLSLPALPSAIERAQKEHNLKIYVVATEQGSDATEGPKLAANKLDELVLKWRNSQNFPVDDYLVILWVRYKDDPARGSVAANGGNRLRAYGMTADHFGSTSGPVIPVLKQHMRERPETALTTIIENVNGEVTAVIESEKNAKAREETLKALPGFILTWGSILAVIGFVIFIWVRFANARSRMRSHLSQFENNLDAVNQLLLALKDRHGSFLKERAAGWETRFKYASLEKLQEGLAAYSELLSIAAGGTKRLTEARRAARAFWFPRVQGSLDAIKLLTEDSITISSREIELEMATLFGGLTVNKVVQPDEIFSNARSLNAKAEAALGEIERKLALVDKTITTVEGIINWCRQQRAVLEKDALSLAPYENTIAEVEEELVGFKRDALRDPITLMLEAPTLSALASKLKDRVQSAIDLAATIEKSSQGLARFVKEVETLRNTAVEYAFPEGQSSAAAATYQLKERGANPDETINEAAGLLMKAHDQLASGDHEKTKATLVLAKAKQEEASAIVKASFTAKTAVENNGHLVAETKASLGTDVDTAKAALAALKRDFLEINFPDASRQYSDAVSTHDGATAAYAAVKTAYDQQLYIKAAELLSELLGNIEVARNDCGAVAARLKLLADYRDQSRTLVAAARQHFKKLGPKLKEHDFTTSKTVDDRLVTAGTEVVNLEGIVSNTMPDWVDAHARATTLTQELLDIELACDAEAELYQETYDLISSLPGDVESAFLALNERTLQPARDAHKNAVSELEALTREVDVAKSDWQVLKDRAVAAHETCQSARKKAAANDAQANGAAVNLAYCKVRARRFARRKHKLLTEANRLYALAIASYARRDWENALKLASAAFKEFLKFDRQCKRRTATLVVKGAPGGGTSAAPTASGSHTASDDGYSAGVAIAIGMSMGSGNPAPTTSGGSSSSAGSSTPSYTPTSTPSYTSDTGGGNFTVDTGGGGFSGGSGGGDY